ncbi:MAG: DNA polymerase III subunit gamma/tau [Clostridia bacterium]|nr:DNA polymerase III subunit gamma/tau [Clostridia bacterium]
MSYLALYRRYRPTDFNGVIGQEHVVKTLVNQIETGRLGHAYLFTGTRGTGKTSTAKIFAKAINCENPINGSPCGKCAACRALSDPSNVDVVEIDAASNNGVNEIRELRENVQFPPVSCKYKVYIVDEVHMLSGAAFNALLKTLEEPPKHAVFILATTEAHKLPATILSRCMRFDFRLVPTEKIAELIAKIYDEQGKKYEKEAVFAIARAGEGSIRDALSIADTAISYGQGTLTYQDVNDILGSSNAELITEFAARLIDGDSGEALRVIENLSSLGKSMGVLNKDVTETIRNLLIIKTCKTAKTILGLPETHYSALQSIAERTSADRLIRILEIFSETDAALRYATHPRVVFETATVKAARPETDYDIDALLARIKTLEDKLNNAALLSAASNSAPIAPANDITRAGQKDNKTELKSSDDTEKADDVADLHTESAETALESCGNGDILATTESGAEQEPAQAKDNISLAELNDDELKGRLLYNLRKSGSEMLWNTMQNVSVKIAGEEIDLLPVAQEDYALLTIETNFNKIKSALDGVEYLSLNVEEPKIEKKLSDIDAATERLKKMFGEDIVIVKR